MSPALDQLSRDLRSAILGEDHVLAGRLASEYAAAVQKLWEATPQNERAASSLPRQSRELLAWAREMTVIQRSMAAAQLTVVEKARYYNSARSAGSPKPIHQLRG